MSTFQELLESGRVSLRTEANALLRCSDRLTEEFAAACKLILDCKGKIVCCGLGKSGHIARKVAATLSSTGTPSYFLHPSEALHGDLGTLSMSDVLLVFSQSGETREAIEVCNFAQRLGTPVVVITGVLSSTLAGLSRVCLSSHVDQEACPLNLAPTASSTVALALGDALAVAVMTCRGTREEDFAKWHPAGSLARRFVSISDVMVPLKDIAFVKVEDSLFLAMDALANRNLGICGVLDNGDRLVGVVSDGDIRRTLRSHGRDAIDQKVGSFMSMSPKKLPISGTIAAAIQQMEEHKITALFVVEKTTPDRPVGLVRLHDIMTAKVI